MSGEDEKTPEAAPSETAPSESPAAAPRAAAGAAASPAVDVGAILGAKGRRALLAKLPPMGVPGGQILDAMRLEPEGDLAKILDLTADDFLDPLWERMQGRSS